MADFLGVDYLQVVVAAIIPACLYFFGVGSMVHFEALLRNLERIPKERLPSFKRTLARGWYRLTPVAVLMYFLATGWSVSFSGLAAIVSTLPVSWLAKETRITPVRLYRILVWGALTALPVVAAVAVVGIVIGVVAHTGFAVKLAIAILELSHGYLFVTLLLGMVASLILGLGLPTTPTYIITAALTAPALIQFGLAPMTAHFFVFYYGILADITPPTAIAAYALAGIASANPQRTMMAACSVALAGYIVPFVFAYEPSMLDPLMRRPETTLYGLIASTLSAALGIVMLSMAIIGWMRVRASGLERAVLALGALCLVVPHRASDIVGLAAFAAIFAVHTRKKAHAAAASADAAERRSG